MKTTFLILILSFNLITCDKKTKNESLANETNIIISNVSEANNEITIKYSTPINGYNVSVKWLIRGKLEVMERSKNFSGPAIITFENIETKKISWIIHPEFTIDIEQKNLKYITVKREDSNGYIEEEFIKNQSFTQVSKYIKPKYKKVGTSKEEEGFGYTYIPFFFQDIDFDDEDELILTYARTYEKGGSQNKIFKSPDYENLEFREMTNEPFNNFSGFYYGNPHADAYSHTTIDYKNKTITHFELSGAVGHGSLIYEFKKQEDSNDYRLFRKTNMNNFSNWEEQETTIYKYDDYERIIKVDNIKTTNG